MKKSIGLVIIALMLVNILSIGFVLAQGNNETGNNENASEDDDVKETDDNVGLNDRNKSRDQIKERVIEKIKERVENFSEYKKNFTFSPWQKRNESECIEGCRCRGAVMVCETENGREMTITAGRSGNTIIIKSVKGNSDDECGNETKECENDDVEAETELEIEQESEGNKTKIKAILGNGRKALIKVMPDVAAERALERLRLRVCTVANNCTIRLKETGEGNNSRATYEVQLERHSRILGIFKKKMDVRAEVNAENGTVEQIKKPWWAFVASEPTED